MRGKRAKQLRKISVSMSDPEVSNKPVKKHGTVLYLKGSRRRMYQWAKKAWTRNLPLDSAL